MDYSVYYSYIHQAAAGMVVFKDYFTSEPQAGGMVNIFWLSIGWFAKLFGFSAQAAFHFSRIFWIGSFVIVAYGFITYLFKDLRYRVIALFFVLYSGGIGAIVRSVIETLGLSDKKAETAIAATYKYAPFPIDLWVPDSNTYLILKQSPHLIASITLMLMVFLLMLFALESKKLSYSIAAGLTATVLFQFHPYQVGTMYGVLGAYFLVLFISKKEKLSNLIRSGAVFLIFSLPSVLYYVWLLFFDWRTRQLAVENICITPPPWYVAAGYGALLVLAAAGIYFFIKTRELYNNRGYIFLGTWLATQALLIYTPVNFQRRMIMGFHIVIAIFAAVGALLISERIGVLARIKKYTAYVCFMVLLLLSFVMAGADFENSVWFYKNKDWFYISPAKQEAMQWVKNHVNDSDVVLASWGNGNVIAGELQKRVFLGHWAETADIEEKTDTLNALFAEANNDNGKMAYFSRNGITHFFFERGSPEISYFESNSARFTKEFSNADFHIYSLKQ
jgi:hypothetical protein